MPVKIPLYSICNLLGADRCLTDCVVAGIQSFMDTHGDLVFPHRHDFYQLVYFTAGGGTHAIDFNHFDIRTDQVYYMMPGQVHTWSFLPETDGIIINFSDSFFSSQYNSPYYARSFPIFSFLNGDPVQNLAGENAKDIRGRFEAIKAEFDQHLEYRSDSLRSMLNLLIIQLSRLQNEAGAAIAPTNRVVLRQFEQLIDEHFRTKKFPKDYAEMLFISPNHLNALTNQVLGQSAGDLIRDRVLLEAKRLLVNSDLLVNQIADHLNFEDNAYFTRFFKKYTGVSPEGFRKSMKTAFA